MSKELLSEIISQNTSILEAMEVNQANQEKVIVSLNSVALAIQKLSDNISHEESESIDLVQEIKDALQSFGSEMIGELKQVMKD